MTNASIIPRQQHFSANRSRRRRRRRRRRKGRRIHPLRMNDEELLTGAKRERERERGREGGKRKGTMMGIDSISRRFRIPDYIFGTVGHRYLRSLVAGHVTRRLIIDCIARS